MASNDGNKKDATEDFDFSNLDWTNGDDKDSGGAGSDDDAFGIADDEFGGSESFLSLEQMPDADNADSFADLGSGDEFGDIGSDDGGADYHAFEDQGAVDTGKVIGQDDAFDADDPYASSFADEKDAAEATPEEEEEVDPFADGEADPAAEAEAAAEPPQSSPIMKYLLAAAAVVVVAGTSYFVVPSLLGGGGEEVQVAQVRPTSPDEQSFPAGLPPQTTPDQSAVPSAQDTLPMPVPATQPGASLDPAPVITLPGADVDMGSGSTPPVQTGQDPNPMPGGLQPVDKPIQLPSVEQSPADPKTDPLADMVGGTQRGGIDAMKGSDKPTDEASQPAPAAHPVPAQADEVAALSRRLEALEEKVGRLSESFDNYVEAKVTSAEATPPAASADTPVTPSSSSVSGVPPMKPMIIESSSLKGVAGEVAWVSTKSGVVEVKVGDDIPGAGKVVSFRNYRGSWILVTTEGLIVRQ